MKRSAAALAEARFKQLCCLAVSREQVLPALLDELHTIVPFSGCTVFFADTQLRVVNSYAEEIEPKTTALYMQEFHGRRGRELGGAFPDAIHRQFGVEDSSDVLPPLGLSMKGFWRSAFYNEILRGAAHDWFLRLMIRNEGGRGRALGSITLYRPRRQGLWSAEEKRRLAALEPFLATAFAANDSTDPATADGEADALIIAGSEGRPLNFSVGARELLFLATHPRVTADADYSRVDQLPAQVKDLCRNLARLFAGDGAAAPPTLWLRNTWGTFTFKAHWLEGGDTAAGLIGIAIRRREPLPIRIVRRVGELELGWRQAQVCVLLANGHSNDAIADRLGISRHTAVAHGRGIYEKLGVHNRAELVSKVLTN